MDGGTAADSDDDAENGAGMGAGVGQSARICMRGRLVPRGSLRLSASPAPRSRCCKVARDDLRAAEGSAVCKSAARDGCVMLTALRPRARCTRNGGAPDRRESSGCDGESESTLHMDGESAPSTGDDSRAARTLAVASDSTGGGVDDNGDDASPPLCAVRARGGAASTVALALRNGCESSINERAATVREHRRRRRSTMGE